MMRLAVFGLLFLILPPKPRYLIVVDDISCKSCVIQLHNYLRGKLGSRSAVMIGTRNHQNLVVNEMIMGYYKAELPAAKFTLISDTALFTPNKYPYLLKIQKNDTVCFPYDQLFIGGNVNAAAFDP